MSNKFAVGQVIMVTPDAGEVGINSLQRVIELRREIGRWQ